MNTKKKKNQIEKVKQRFSIKKFKNGAGSVLIGLALFGAMIPQDIILNTQYAQAAQTHEVAELQNKVKTTWSSSSVAVVNERVIKEVTEAIKAENPTLPIDRVELTKNDYYMIQPASGNDADDPTGRVEETDNRNGEVIFTVYFTDGSDPITVSHDKVLNVVSNGQWIRHMIEFYGLQPHQKIRVVDPNNLTDAEKMGIATIQYIHTTYVTGEALGEMRELDKDVGLYSYVSTNYVNNDGSSFLIGNNGFTQPWSREENIYILKVPELEPVADPQNLTDAEKAMVEENVRKANPDLPEGTKITVANDGSVTVSYPEGSAMGYREDATEEEVMAYIQKLGIDPEDPVDGLKLGYIYYILPIGTPVDDTLTPTQTIKINKAKGQDSTIAKNTAVTPKDSISNVGDLPDNTTFEWETPVDTTSAGEVKATVVVTYTDSETGKTITERVPVTITVTEPNADTYEPVGKDQSVNLNEEPKAEDSVENFGDLPTGTTASFKTPVDTSSAGDKPATVVVTYPDGTTDELEVTVKVVDNRTDADKNEPVGKDQSVNLNEE
ncbi:YSIRK-type signal peptide-containing protein, partial [Gemella sp. GH3]|uniref:Rib/alpha-like domain-containing protein n=3 Tax=unclassified Gemella TaxID=2624949 RepID=UPI0015D00570